MSTFLLDAVKVEIYTHLNTIILIYYRPDGNIFLYFVPTLSSTITVS